MGKRIISYSEIETAKQCSLKHQLSYVERWSRPQDPLSALGKGTAWHAVMEAHYLALRQQQVSGSPQLQEYTLSLCRTAAEKVMREMPDELADLIEWMYSGYVGLYGADPEWEILAVEHNAVCRIPTLAGTPSSFWLKVKIDLVVRNRRTRNVYVVDHKSGKDLPGEKSLELDDQFGEYTWAMRKLGKKVFGQIYNAARTYRLQGDVKNPGSQALEDRFRRVPLYRTDKELDATIRDLYMLARSRYREQAEVTRAGAMSPRATDPERCSWRCDFKEACLAGRKGINIQGFLRDQRFVQSFERH